MNPLIELKDVTYAPQGKTTLNNISLQIMPRQIVTLIGPNGAGKTTLAKLILGLIKPNKGTVTRKASLRVGYMPQRFPIDHNLPLSVDNFLALSGAKKEARINALKTTGVAHLAHHQISWVSGGEMQRVLLARAILKKPDLLVLDEPAQGVDLPGQSYLYQLINRLRDELHCAIVLVSHDLHLVMANSDDVICLNQHICCQGTPDSVYNNPEYVALFGQLPSPNITTYTHHHDHHHDIDGAIDTPCQHENHAHD